MEAVPGFMCQITLYCLWSASLIKDLAYRTALWTDNFFIHTTLALLNAHSTVLTRNVQIALSIISLCLGYIGANLHMHDGRQCLYAGLQGSAPIMSTLADQVLPGTFSSPDKKYHGANRAFSIIIRI